MNKCICVLGLSVARAMQDWSSAGWRAYDVAMIHYNRANIDDASLWTNCCAEVWERAGGKREQCLGAQMRGLVAQQHKRYSEAEGFLQSSLAICRDLGDDEWIAAVLDDLGDLARECQDYNAAERNYRGALELAKKIDDKEGQASCIGHLGELTLDREQWMEARKMFEQELVLAKEAGRKSMIAHAQYGLSRAWEAEERADLALPLAQEALTIYERLQHRDLAAARELVERLKGPLP